MMESTEYTYINGCDFYDDENKSNNKNDDVEEYEGKISNNCRMNSLQPISYQRYEFPVLAEDPSSVSRARRDPLACNVNNDAVLIWNDVIYQRQRHDRDVLCDNVTSHTSLPEYSIEDVFQDLETTASAYSQSKGSSFVISNGDDIDGIDKENLKEHIPDRRYRQNNHDRHEHEEDVVTRRRLFEQGLDLPYISILEENHCSENCNSNENNRFVNNDVQVSISTSNKYECIDNGGEHVYENYPLRNCDSSSLLIDETKLEEPGNECKGWADDECYDLDDVDLNASEVQLRKKPGRRYKPKTKSNEDSGEVFTVVQNNASTSNAGEERSFLDSGHFEDISSDLLLSPYRNSTGSEVFLDNDNNYQRSKNSGADIVNGYSDGGCVEDEEERDEQYVSQSDLHHASPVRIDLSDVHDDSEVFLEDGKEIDTMEQYHNETPRATTLVHRERSIRTGGVKLHQHRNKSRLKNKRKPSHNASEEEGRGSVRWKDDVSIMVQCANEACKNVSNLVEARKGYKNCHHCLRTYYCSRGCRREDWQRHKEKGFCHGSKVSSACKKVIEHCNTNPEIKAVLSRLAVRCFLAHGRGCVMLGFPDLDSTEEFLEFGFPMLELNPIYVTAKELSESKMYGNILEKLLETCRTYKPEIKFVLNVGVGLQFSKEDFLSFSWQHQGNQYCYRNQNHEEMDTFDSQGSEFDLGYGSLSSNLNTSGKSMISSTSSPSTPKSRGKHWFVFDNSSQRSPSSRHKAPILQKFLKMKLSPVHAQHEHEKRLTFEKHFWDEFRTAGPTLILTGIPERSGPDIDQSESRKRELTFINIQRKLRERNVNLRRQYPSIHANLIAYVTSGVHFPSQVLFPIDTKTGRTFTCFMMPEAEAELEWMQSHHLLSDLELSKDSLNKSMTKSLSSSMPSLCCTATYKQSPTHTNSQSNRNVTPCGSKIGSSVECIQNTDNTSRSTSLHRAESVDYIMVQPTEGSKKSANSMSYRFDCSGSHGEMKYSTENEIGMCEKKFEATEKELDTKKDGDSSSRSIQFNEEPESIIVPPLDLDVKVSSSNPEILVDSDKPLETFCMELVCENKREECQWATSHRVTPRFHPVRKARNVTLYSNHTKHSNLKLKPNSVPCPETPRLKPWQLSIDCDSTSLAVAPLLFPSSPSSTQAATSALITTSSALSPVLYTSTPKSTKPPEFDAVFESNLSLSLNTSPSRQNPHGVTSPRHQNASPYAKLPACNNCSCHQRHVGVSVTENANADLNVNHSELDNGCSETINIPATIKEYGFDSCYRNKIVVDEVDQMKRRRKDRKSKLRPSPSTASPISPLHPLDLRSGLEYDWFENDALQSPPLATSTIERRGGDNTWRGHQEQGTTTNLSSRKVKDRYSESHGHNENRQTVHMDKNNNDYYHSRPPVYTCPGFPHESCHLQHSTGREPVHIGSGHECSSTGHRKCLDKNNNISNINRKNNDYRVTTISTPKMNVCVHDYNDNECDEGIYESLIEHEPSNDIDHCISNIESLRDSSNSKESPLSTKHFTPNDTDRHNANESSPHRLHKYNTRKALTSKRSHRSHSNNNTNNNNLNYNSIAMTSSGDNNPHHALPAHHHDHRNPNHHHHIRMRLFDDVTHHLANQNDVSPISNIPKSSAQTSKRKIKFNLPDSNPNSISSFQHQNHDVQLSPSTHSQDERRKPSSLRRKSTHGSHTVAFNTEIITHQDKKVIPSACQILQAVNISYSSDW